MLCLTSPGTQSRKYREDFCQYPKLNNVVSVITANNSMDAPVGIMNLLHYNLLEEGHARRSQAGELEVWPHRDLAFLL